MKKYLFLIQITNLKTPVCGVLFVFSIFFICSCTSLPLEKLIVRGDSLSPLIKNGDEVEFKRLNGRKIKRGDIVVFNYPGRKTPVAKVVCAVGGDKFFVREINGRKSELLINGKILLDAGGNPYIFSSQKTKMLKLYEKDFEGTVPEGFFLIFGAKSCDACLDSGKFGFLSIDKIIGIIIH